jgi:hypothetical protein
MLFLKFTSSAFLIRRRCLRYGTAGSPYDVCFWGPKTTSDFRGPTPLLAAKADMPIRTDLN